MAKAPYGFIRKVKRMNKLRARYEALSDELKNWSKEHHAIELKEEGIGWFRYKEELYVSSYMQIARKPMGKPVGDGAYDNRYAEPSEEGMEGTYYFPIEGSTKYLAVEYVIG